MSQRIPEAFIDDLVARTDIAELIGSRVTLKRAGREYKGLCPFHDEKTPSFTVSTTKGFYHCFGCGAHGTAIGFLMNYDNLGFPEAVETLADRLGIELPKVLAAHEPVPGHDLYAVLERADQIYRQGLRETPRAVEYLQQRGIDGATAARFGIGYARDAWDSVLRQLGEGHDTQITSLIEAGLVIRNQQDHCYDRFRDRIMFPIRNPRGRVIGFGGRTLGDGEPKYLNSPETPIFHKGRGLYGIHEARREPGRPTEVLVVEGYMDVVSLSQFGINSVVATLGTATTSDHVRQLARMTDRIVFCFDGDRAGRAAAWRALETALPQAGGQLEIAFLLLPSNEDPDSLVRSEGPDAVRARMANALPLSEFLVDELTTRVDIQHADGRAKLVALAEPLLGKLPRGSVYRELLGTSLAERVGLEPHRFNAQVEAEVERRNPAPPTATATPAARRGGAHKHFDGAGGATRDAGKSPRIRSAIKLILHYPSVVRAMEPVDGLAAVDLPGADLLRQLLEIAGDHPDINRTAQLLERFRGQPHEEPLQRLAMKAPLDDEGVAADVLHDNLKLIVLDHLRRQRGKALRAREPDALNSD